MGDHAGRWMTECRIAGRRQALLAAGLVVLLVLYGPISQAADDPVAGDGLHRVVSGGHELIVLDPRRVASSAESPSAEDSQGAGFSARSYETGSRRIHVVTYEGKTYRAATPLEGPFSRAVFDPARRRFWSLLPSIRVELGEDAQPEAWADAIGAVGVTVFERLGFAIFHLPADLHPAQAVARVGDLPGEPVAEVRLRAPRIEWK